MNNQKVVIIGDGAVGSSTAYTLFLGNAANEIVIIDVNRNKAEGDVLDMAHGMSFVSPKNIKAGGYEDIKSAHVVIITAGVAQKEGETRIALLKRNLAIFDSIISNMKPYLDESAIVLVVTNPVDVLSYYTYKKLGIESHRVIGSGTVLDTARLRRIISEDTRIDSRNIHTFIVGEHGDSEVAVFSVTTVGGVTFSDYCKTCKGCKDTGICNKIAMVNKVRGAAYDIIAKKGATYYAVALAVSKITEAIINDQHSVLTISSYMNKEFDGRVDDIYMSLPTVVSKTGVTKIMHPQYSSSEIEEIIHSANSIKEVIKSI